MLKSSVVFAITGAALVLATGPVRAQAAAQTPAVHETHLEGLSAAEAADLVARVREAQAGLRRGDSLYFQLLSGAPASYEMTATSPRDAFLNADFSHPFKVERRSPGQGIWKPYRITLTPDGLGTLLWEVTVMIGSNDQIERIEMLYQPPAPF